MQRKSGGGGFTDRESLTRMLQKEFDAARKVVRASGAGGSGGAGEHSSDAVGRRPDLVPMFRNRRNGIY